VRFIVSKYIPEGLYGFLEAEGGQRAFFHLSEFKPMGGPPPISGEVVEVARLEPNGDKSPRARVVERQNLPKSLTGLVIRFDSNIGYGFVATPDGTQYFLHRSEFSNGELPRVGMTVTFFIGGESKPGKPSRACYPAIIDRGEK